LRTETSTKPCLIGIAGPSCAGKTELARRLADTLDAPIVALDCYYHSLDHLPLEQRARSNFDVPESLDADLLARHVRQLARGEEIQVPIYDFTCHHRTTAVRAVRATRYALIEGLFTLHWEAVRELLDVKLYVGAADSVCLRRRIERDVRERGRTPESVLEQYRTTVEPMARQYVFPTAAFAGLVLDGEARIDESIAAALAVIRGAR
jgi:uridine kinase